jgi:hypothetical protein
VPTHPKAAANVLEVQACVSDKSLNDFPVIHLDAYNLSPFSRALVQQTQETRGFSPKAAELSSENAQFAP